MSKTNWKKKYEILKLNSEAIERRMRADLANYLHKQEQKKRYTISISAQFFHLDTVEEAKIKAKELTDAGVLFFKVGEDK
jgi:hypothetical protein